MNIVLTNLHFFPFTNWILSDFLQSKDLLYVNSYISPYPKDKFK